MARPLAPDELAALLRDTTRAEAKAAPVSARAVIARGLVAGCGAILLTGGGLWMLAAPGEIVANWGLTTGVIVAGVTMLAGSVPAEKIGPLLLTARRIQQVQATVTAAEFRKRKAYEAVEELEAQTAARIAELEKAIAELRLQNKTLRSEKQIIAKQTQNPRWTPRSKVDAATRKRAETILQHWFTTLRTDAKGKIYGEWWSRPKATAAGWTKTEHGEAVQLLEDAELIGQNGLLPFVLADVRDLADAMDRLDAYCREVEQEPVMPRPYVEQNEDF